MGLVIGGVDFKDLKLTLREAVIANGEVVAEAVTINYGNFIKNLLDFLIIAFAIFMVIRTLNKLKRKKEVEKVIVVPAEPAKPTNEEVLLTEIRDLLSTRPKI